MIKKDFHDDLIHAFVDGQVDSPTRHRVLEAMERDPKLRERIHEQQRTKDWVRSAFEGEKAPTRRLPANMYRYKNPAIYQSAASLLIGVIAFGAGWALRDTQGNWQEQVAAGSGTQQTQHVILHISESDPALFVTALDKAEWLLDTYKDADVQVEVVTNAGGLDMVRMGTSTQIKRIERLVDQYDNVKFIACTNGLDRLKKSGIKPVLIKGTIADMPAADHLLKRLQNGWTYIKI